MLYSINMWITEGPPHWQACPVTFCLANRVSDSQAEIEKCELGWAGGKVLGQ